MYNKLYNMGAHSQQDSKLQKVLENVKCDLQTYVEQIRNDLHDANCDYVNEYLLQQQSIIDLYNELGRCEKMLELFENAITEMENKLPNVDGMNNALLDAMEIMNTKIVNRAVARDKIDKMTKFISHV